MSEATSVETPFGRYITSDGWFVLNLQDALAVRNEEKGGATYPPVTTEAGVPEEAYADWPGEYEPVRLPWPLESSTSA